ncbi:MAG: hypothetical protein AAGK98_18445 [Pseudomonadota bacterium]
MAVQAAADRRVPVQRISQIDYGPPQQFQYSNPVGQIMLQQDSDVGSSVRARLDLTDPIKGSDVGSGQVPAALFADIIHRNGGTWFRGHLLNSKLGGLGLANNLYPITSYANEVMSSGMEREMKEELYNQPNSANLSLANYGYMEVDVQANSAIVPASNMPDADIVMSYRTQKTQAAPVAAPAWNAWQTSTVRSRARTSGNTAVPGTWAPYGTGQGVPQGGGGGATVSFYQSNQRGTMNGSGYMVQPIPPFPQGAKYAILQQLGGGAPNLKFIGWRH